MLILILWEDWAAGALLQLLLLYRETNFSEDLCVKFMYRYPLYIYIARPLVKMYKSKPLHILRPVLGLYKHLLLLFTAYFICTGSEKLK